MIKKKTKKKKTLVLETNVHLKPSLNLERIKMYKLFRNIILSIEINSACKSMCSIKNETN